MGTIAARLRVVNGTIVTPHRWLYGGALEVEGSRITAVGKAADDGGAAGEIFHLADLRDAARLQKYWQSGGNAEGKTRITLDVDGAYVLPGFIDSHLHGAGGHDISDGGTEPIEKVAAVHARGGITSFLPTTIACSSAKLLEIVGSVRTLIRQKAVSGARVLGLHVEGPYLHPSQRGAHPLDQVRNPDPEEYEDWLAQSDVIKRMTVAPELPGALELGRRLRDQGIIASMGHTTAHFEGVQAALDAGYSVVTHYLCSISQSQRLPDRKIAGLAEAALAYDDLTVELIADNMHLPPGIPKMVYQRKGPDKTMIVTDAMRAAGMPDGEYCLGDEKNGQKVIVDQGVAWIPDRTSFAGSVAMGHRMLRNLVESSHVPLDDAVRMMTWTPARLLRVDNRKGCLSPGMDADLVVLRTDFSVICTVVEGELVYVAGTR